MVNDEVWHRWHIEWMEMTSLETMGGTVDFVTLPFTERTGLHELCVWSRVLISSREMAPPAATALGLCLLRWPLWMRRWSRPQSWPPNYGAQGRCHG